LLEDTLMEKPWTQDTVTELKSCTTDSKFPPLFFRIYKRQIKTSWDNLRGTSWDLWNPLFVGVLQHFHGDSPHGMLLLFYGCNDMFSWRVNNCIIFCIVWRKREK
jgi:hypothetical protein